MNRHGLFSLFCSRDCRSRSVASLAIAPTRASQRLGGYLHSHPALASMHAFCMSLYGHISGRTGLAQLANSAPATLREAEIALAPMANEYLAGESEWWEVPYGDVPYSLEKVQGVQRLNRQIAERMVSLWNSFRGRITRRFGGSPLYRGHPDHEFFANHGDTDDGAYGWILDLEAGEDALRLRVELSAPGQELLANKRFKWFSPFFLGRAAGTENGKNVYEPIWLKSVGLTNQPRWPVAALVNEEPDPAAATQEDPEMELLKRLISLLGLPNAEASPATPESVVSAVEGLVNSAAKTRAALDARWDAQDAALAAVPNEAPIEERLAALLAAGAARLETLANERGAVDAQLAAAIAERDAAQSAANSARKAHIELLVNEAVSAGRITPAQRDQWIADLAAATDLDAKAAELANAQAGMKTSPKTGDLGARSSAALRAGSRSATIVELVNAKMNPALKGADYHATFLLVKRDHPELFGEEGGQ
jgi:hypothetical protein